MSHKDNVTKLTTEEIEKALSTLEASQALWPNNKPPDTIDVFYERHIETYRSELKERNKQ